MPVVALAAIGCVAAGHASARGCVPERSALPENVLAGYRANPAELIADGERGSGVVSSRVRNAVASDSEMIGALAPTLKSAQGESARSIGVGLGSAAQICARDFPLLSRAIQRAVEESGNPAVQQAFASIIGDQAVLSTGASAGGPALGSATLGGGPHRPTETPSYGFASPTTSITSGTFASPSGGTDTSSRNSLNTLAIDTSAFRSASGVRQP